MDITVILVDDHKLVRAGIRSLLNKVSDVKVIGEAAEGRDALALVASLKPHVVLMDIAMAGLNGLEAARHISADHPGTRVIMLSMHSSEEYVLQSLQAGAAGYLLKDASTGELEAAIKAVVRGELFLSPAISRSVVDRFLKRLPPPPGPLEVLTPRQREVLQLIAEGKSTKEIAFMLKLSPKTIETHRAQLMDRLRIHDVASLVRFALRSGLVVE
jgi:DNA-binding NarL/FixJ family response regulator